MTDRLQQLCNKDSQISMNLGTKNEYDYSQININPEPIPNNYPPQSNVPNINPPPIQDNINNGKSQWNLDFIRNTPSSMKKGKRCPVCGNPCGNSKKVCAICNYTFQRGKKDKECIINI